MSQTYSILLVDDDATFRFAVSRALIIRGYDVITAENAEVALKHLSTVQVDLVITDIKMPGIDGFELITWLKERQPDVVVLMTTAYNSMAIEAQSIEAGALRFLAKPVDLEELADILKNILGETSWKGAIRDLDLFDYVQLVTTTRKNKILQMSSAARVGYIYIKDGQIVHALCEETTGKSAFVEILSWAGGDVEDKPWEEPEAYSIQEKTSVLMMEEVIRRDKEKRALFEISSASMPRPTPIPEETSAHPPSWYDRALGGWKEVDGLDGALLLRDGALLATCGYIPRDMQRIIVPLTTGCSLVGDQLGLGRYDKAVLNLKGGVRLSVQPLGNFLILGIKLQGNADVTAVQEWVRSVAEQAG